MSKNKHLKCVICTNKYDEVVKRIRMAMLWFYHAVCWRKKTKREIHNFIQLLLGICWAETRSPRTHIFFHCIPIRLVWIRLASLAIKILRTCPLKAEKKFIQKQKRARKNNNTENRNGNQTNWKNGFKKIWNNWNQLQETTNSNGMSVDRPQANKCSYEVTERWTQTFAAKTT